MHVNTNLYDLVDGFSIKLHEQCSHNNRDYDDVENGYSNDDDDNNERHSSDKNNNDNYGDISNGCYDHNNNNNDEDNVTDNNDDESDKESIEDSDLSLSLKDVCCIYC